jgi:hypothetical protein
MVPSLDVSATPVAETAVGVLARMTDFVLNATVGDAAIVVCNLLFLFQLLLDDGKMVHWIPPVGFLLPFLQAVFVPKGMNDAFRCLTCN